MAAVSVKRSIVHRCRLLVWIKPCRYIERYSPLDLFEPAERGYKNSATNELFAALFFSSIT